MALDGYEWHRPHEEAAKADQMAMVARIPAFLNIIPHGMVR
jgi:hypothetical protein